MLLFVIAFIAGVLTVLAPCVLPLLPIIVGGSVSGGMDKRRAYTVALSLGASVILFTLILKFSTAFIYVPQYAWEWISGGILIVFGIVTLFPRIWDSLGIVNRVNRESNKLMSAGYMRQNFWGDVLVGAALGPVFSTCSPTYFVILATVLPASFAVGLIDLLAYTSGLVLMLLIVSLAGQKVVDKLGIAADPNGWFRKTIGALFVVVGLLVFSGAERPIEAWLITHVYDITMIEQTLLKARQDAQGSNTLQCSNGICTGPASSTQLTATSSPDGMPVEAIVARKALRYPRAPEITKPAGFVNTGDKPITIGEFKGQKVVLIDFWTYSCINCQRTLPYLKAWDEKYRDQGLQIIGIHTPEFAFEKLKMNVEDAVKGFGLKYPSVLDNDYGTWNAFGNSYWPRKYLIDIDGYIVYDHAGEGEYEEAERAIQAALAERAARFGTSKPATDIASPDAETAEQVGSPEIYFGAWRNEYFANGRQGVTGVESYTLPTTIALNELYFGGTWNIASQYAESATDSTFVFKYRAKAVYLVAGSADNTPILVEVQRDGKSLEKTYAGSDIIFKDGKSYVEISGNRLYKIIGDSASGVHELKFIVSKPKLQVYTFTFG